MKILRWLAAGLVGTLAAVVGLVGVLLCVTLILLPLGIPVLMLSYRLFKAAGAMVVPRALRHPVDELDKAGESAAGKVKGRMRKGAKSGSKKAGRATGKAIDKGKDKGKKITRRAKKKTKKKKRRLRTPWG